MAISGIDDTRITRRPREQYFLSHLLECCAEASPTESGYGSFVDPVNERLGAGALPIGRIRSYCVWYRKADLLESGTPDFTPLCERLTSNNALLGPPPSQPLNHYSNYLMINHLGGLPFYLSEGGTGNKGADLWTRGLGTESEFADHSVRMRPSVFP